MARTSRRNFLTLFRGILVDDSDRGPDVSSDVELVYLADDLRQRSYVYAGAGLTEAAVVGENGIVSIECRVSSGLEIQQLTMNLATPIAAGTTVRVWTSLTEPTITGPVTLVTALNTVGLPGLPQAPLSSARSGTIITALIPATAFRYVNVASFVWPFFINQGQFFNCALATANQAVDLGIRWRELRLFS